jgi:hypothetical protein
MGDKRSDFNVGNFILSRLTSQSQLKHTVSGVFDFAEIIAVLKILTIFPTNRWFLF